MGIQQKKTPKQHIPSKTQLRIEHSEQNPDEKNKKNREIKRSITDKSHKNESLAQLA